MQREVKDAERVKHEPRFVCLTSPCSDLRPATGLSQRVEKIGSRRFSTRNAANGKPLQHI